jgi:hypothetical protein
MWKEVQGPGSACRTSLSSSLPGIVRLLWGLCAIQPLWFTRKYDKLWPTPKWPWVSVFDVKSNDPGVNFEIRWLISSKEITIIWSLDISILPFNLTCRKANSRFLTLGISRQKHYDHIYAAFSMSSWRDYSERTIGYSISAYWVDFFLWSFEFSITNSTSASFEFSNLSHWDQLWSHKIYTRILESQIRCLVPTTPRHISSSLFHY